MNNGIDVLLVTTPRPPHLSPAAVQVSENSAPPLGLLNVAAALEGAGFIVSVHDFYQLGGTPADILALIDKLRPCVVGISALTSGVHLALAMAGRIKCHDPSIVTVLGGPHATALPDEVIANPQVDFAVRGEGEYAMVDLMRAGADKNALGRTPGLCFRHGDRVVVTSDRPPMPFDDAPLPARHLVPMNRYHQKGAIVTSRGCAYHCWFCSSVTFNTHKYRYRSSALVLEEMDMIHQRYRVTDFEFIEDTFTCDTSRVLELMGLLRRRSYEWACQATIPDLVRTPEQLPAMVEGGCRGLFFGIESGNDDVLKKIKNMSRGKVLATIDRARHEGVRHFVASFIVGHPWDTRSTISDTLSLMQELRARGAHTPLSILVPFPGSPIAKWPERFGITIHSRDYRDYYYDRAVISTRNLSREELQDIYFDALELLTSKPGGRERAGSLSRSRILRGHPGVGGGHFSDTHDVTVDSLPLLRT